MQARDIMSTEVATVGPDTPTGDIARLLLARSISAVPVVDAAGAPIGMVSEGDLVGRSEAERTARRDWWLALLAEGEPLSSEFLASLRQPQRTARAVMSAPVVAIREATELPEIARLLAEFRIKRVPVLREGRIVGIVSRADLVRALAAEGQETVAEHRGLLAAALAGIDRSFHTASRPAEGAAATTPPRHAGPTAADFRDLMADFEHDKQHRRDEAWRAAAKQRRRRVKELIEQHVLHGEWQALLHRAREAAEHGAGELLLLRFPSELCSDGGRAINVPRPDWPATLRGEAAEIYLLWERELKPAGFRLDARILDFPGGFPGDAGLFLGWSE